MQERVLIDRRAPAGKPRKRTRSKGRSAGGRKRRADLPPRFRGSVVPLAIRLTRIWPEDIVPGLRGEFSGQCQVNCDLVITVAGRRVPRLVLDESTDGGAVSLNEWLRILHGLRYDLYRERRLVCRATWHQRALVFERKGRRVAFSIRDRFRKQAVPGFEQMVLDRDVLLRALRDFVAKAKRLVLKAAPNHAEADAFWGYHVAMSIDDPDDVDDYWRGVD